MNSTIPLCQPSATSLHSDNSSSVIMCHSSNVSLQSNEASSNHPSFRHSSTDDLCDTSAVDLCYSPDIPSPPTQRKKPKKKSVSVRVRIKGKNKGKTLSYDNCIIVLIFLTETQTINTVKSVGTQCDLSDAPPLQRLPQVT